METVDHTQWSSQDWGPPASTHYRYQESASQRWYPSLPPPPQHYYHESSTASTSPSSQHLSPPTPHQQLLSNSETSNIMGFLDGFHHSVPYAPAARGGDHWHQQPHQRHPTQHHHFPQHHLHHHPSSGAIPPSVQPDYPPTLCAHPMSNRPVQGLYPKIEYPEPELDTKDHVFHYNSPPPGSSNSTAPSPPSHLPPLSASRPSQAPSHRNRSSSSTQSSSDTASPPDKSLSLHRGHNGTSPQKRMNHIMSEQRRRNAIREGYHTLIQLLAPEDGGPMIEMPTRGRPKGSSAKNKNRKRGKSGILFRAVEFTNWLEEGNDALRQEVARIEAASAHG